MQNFHPKTPFSGKRKSRPDSDSEYKRDDDPTNNDSIMSPKSSFQLVLDQDEQDWDLHIITKRHKANEIIPYGLYLSFCI